MDAYTNNLAGSAQKFAVKAMDYQARGAVRAARASRKLVKAYANEIIAYHVRQQRAADREVQP